MHYYHYFQPLQHNAALIFFYSKLIKLFIQLYSTYRELLVRLQQRSLMPFRRARQPVIQPSQPAPPTAPLQPFRDAHEQLILSIFYIRLRQLAPPSSVFLEFFFYTLTVILLPRGLQPPSLIIGSILPRYYNTLHAATD